MEGPIRESSRMLEAMTHTLAFSGDIVTYGECYYIHHILCSQLEHGSIMFKHYEPPGRSAAVAAGSREPQGYSSWELAVAILRGRSYGETFQEMA